MEIVKFLLLAVGVFFGLLSAVGLWRLKSPLERLHASSKASTLGIGFVLLSLGVHHFNDWGTLFKILLTLWFIVLTSPIIGHLLGLVAEKDQTKNT